MKRLVKLLILLVMVGGIAYGISYAGARAAVGKFLGIQPPDLGTRSVRFAYQGADGVPGSPRAWEFTFSKASIFGNRPVKLYVSAGGKILATVPKDLDRRLEAWAKSKEPQ